MALTVSEVDMPQFSAAPRGAGSPYPIAEALWVLAGIVVLLAFGDAVLLVVLASAIAALAAIWWIHRDVERRARRGDAALAPVTALPRRRVGPSATAHGRWRGPRAA
ncbi:MULTISPECIES: hypothetical protein [unclassified Mycobacterium]|uniref:hypothetical protein n=1 Tax=unclassified Mycobacterium TaxID=2642494 RepID=UPI00080002F9|nr:MULTISPECIES: hypothetical protein [unclassified Mycobacterium]OBG72821.1 hypothetical protein A5700_08225 [Mycobacterium sp. E1214]OBH22697.1 hypothetical protein A5693_01295 [Mycobacterium sp. E1319]